MNSRLTRRRALGAFGAAGLGALLAACTNRGDDNATTATTNSTSAPTTAASGSTAAFDDAAACAVTPEMTEGPYYLDVDAIRRDITDGRPGAPLTLAIRVRDAEACEPIPDALVEIWHCDAVGDYSGVDGDDESYLRGGQITDSDGVVEFTTLYPGFYPGRTVHIHAKVHPDRGSELTTQLFFDDDFTDEVYTVEPYASRPDRDVRNGDDSIFADAVLLTLSQRGDGYLGVINLDVEAV